MSHTSEWDELQVTLTAVIQSELRTLLQASLLQASGGAVPYADPFEGAVLLDAVQKVCAVYAGPDFSQLKFEVGEVTPEMRRSGRCPPIYIYKRAARVDGDAR